MLEFERQRALYAACDPYASLEPDDGRNVDIDQLSGGSVRGESWAGRLARKIELAPGPSFQLFTGLPGSGKTTELKRLRKALMSPENSGYVVAYLDATEALDSTGPIDIPDVIANVVHAVETEVRRAEGTPDSAPRGEGYLQRFWQFVTTTDLIGKEVQISIPGGSNMTLEMRNNPSFRDQVRRIVASRLGDFLREAEQSLIELRVRAEKRGRRGVVVIFDQLERVGGMVANWTDVLDSFERVFVVSGRMRLPVHTIFTIPPALYFRANVTADAVEFMPMIAVRDKEGGNNAQGISAMRALIEQRLGNDGIRALFGPEPEPLLRKLILSTGGYAKEIVAQLREILTGDKFPVNEAGLQKLINRRWAAYRAVVPQNAYEWLAEVVDARAVIPQDDTHRRIVDELLVNSVLMRYLNGDEWWGIHPAAEQLPGVVTALETIRSRRKRMGSGSTQ